MIPQELQLQRKSLFRVMVLQVRYIDVVSEGDILANAAKNDRCASVNNPVPTAQNVKVLHHIRYIHKVLRNPVHHLLALYFVCFHHSI